MSEKAEVTCSRSGSGHAAVSGPTASSTYHSCRSTSAGSIRIARHSGHAVAKEATQTTNVIAAAIASGSCGETLNNIERINADATDDPQMPTMVPTITMAIVRRPIIAAVLAPLAPSALRMAISRRRRVTAYASAP